MTQPSSGDERIVRRGRFEAATTSARGFSLAASQPARTGNSFFDQGRFMAGVSWSQ